MTTLEVVYAVFSMAIFLLFTVLIIREYEKNDMRQEFGYRIWTLGFMAEGTILLLILTQAGLI
ncbi:hypothetical protein VPHD148_0032 [Vibrio phage D148]